jgi:hypothetical protein
VVIEPPDSAQIRHFYCPLFTPFRDSHWGGPRHEQGDFEPLVGREFSAYITANIRANL